MFFRIITVLLLTLSINTSSAGAFTTEEAQVCADKLLKAYNKKTYPKNLLALENIVATAFGGIYRSFTKSEIKLAQSVGEELIRESFTRPSGEYRYWDLVVETTEKTDKELEYRVNGTVSVAWPKGTGNYSFLALVFTPGCKVRQVRIADVMTLVNQVQTALAKDSRVRELFND